MTCVTLRLVAATTVGRWVDAGEAAIAVAAANTKPGAAIAVAVAVNAIK